MTLNRGHTYVELVPAPDEGATLLAWLTRRHDHSDADAWAARLAAGELAIDDAVTHDDARLRRNQRVTWARPPWNEPDVPRDVTVCLHDDDVVVVNKPSGLPTMPAGGFLDHTLLVIVRERWPDASPMHRLGRGTSGLVLFARTPRARSALQAAFREGGVDKRYLTRVTGSPAWDTLTIDTPIGPVEHPLLGTLHAATPDGRASRSHATVLSRRADDAVVQVGIDTGRPHQIRIHMASVGHPLVGDPLYGVGGTPRTDALPGDLGYDLQAATLTFPHPRDGARVTVHAPKPDWL